MLQGPGLNCYDFYAQERTDEIVAYTTCAPRGEQGETLPYSIFYGVFWKGVDRGEFHCYNNHVIYVTNL